MKTIAAVLDRCGYNPRPYADNQPLSLRTLTLDPPQRGELLVRIDAAGVCHSDLSVLNGDRPRPVPMAIGHEATGIIEALGDSEEHGFAVGGRVILAFLPACGECIRCCSGEAYMCAAGAAAKATATCMMAARKCITISAPRPSPSTLWAIAAPR